MDGQWNHANTASDVKWTKKEVGTLKCFRRDLVVTKYDFSQNDQLCGYTVDLA